MADGSVNLPRPLTEILWRDGAEERKERHGNPAPAFQLRHACSCFCVSPFCHAVADAWLGEDVSGAVRIVGQFT